MSNHSHLKNNNNDQNQMNHKNICPNCNNRIINDSRFCSNCGHSLEIKCPKCNSALSFNMKYCKDCGTLLIPDLSIRQQKKLNINHNKKKKKQIQKSSNKIKIISAFIVLIGIILVFQFSNDKQEDQHFSLNEIKSNDVFTELKVIEIASKFNCSCGTCGVTPLETCTCNTAIQERQYIRNALQNGQTSQKITEEIQNNYGSMKPEFLNESL